jgi:methylmalonyl-CoA carboxyltransferase small subunit
LKLRITVEGKTYEVDVEILEDEDAEHPYFPYSPAPATYTPPPLPVSSLPPEPPENYKDGARVCRSPVTGLVIQVNVVPGQQVQMHDVLMVLEAMKMENQVTATHSGIVKSVSVTPGNSVKVHQVLLELE